MKVRNMTSANGKPVANQFIVSTTNGTEYFQSYETVIAVRQGDGRIILDENSWDFSTTTGKYRDQFLGEKRVDTVRKIDSGEYILMDLN